MTGRLAALFAPIVKAAKLAAWPVGSIYMSMVATNPGTLFGGTWERIANGRMLIGADSASYPAGSTGGEKTHKLTISEMPSHSHPMAEVVGWPLTTNPETEWSVAYTSTPSYPYTKWSTSTHSRGDNIPHNNLPPYIAVYMWRRTA